jgi:predicted amidohydrolase
MRRNSRIISAALVVTWVTTLAGLVDSVRVTGADLPARKSGPRKVIVGTLVYNMYHEYPGLEKRLAELGSFIDQMVEQVKTQYPGRQLDIAALPEMAINGNARGSAAQVSLPLEGRVLEYMGSKARQHNCYVTVPMYLVDDRERGIYSNAITLLDRRGQVVGTYRKVFPVGGGSSEVLEGGVTPGREFPVFDCDFGRVGFQICFDIYFDEGWEALGKKGAELVIWSTQTPQQISSAFRAMRNNYYVLTSTWRTNASLLDPTGHRIREIPGDVGVFVEQIDLDWIVLAWQSKLRDGKIFTEHYGDRAGFRYSRAEDGGIFWSNDPGKPIIEMIRELKLTLPADHIRRNREIQDKLRLGPIEKAD